MQNSKRHINIIDNEASASLARAIIPEDIKKDNRWNEAPIVTNNNDDILILSNVRVEQHAKETHQILTKWKKPLMSNGIPLSAKHVLYEKNEKLIGRFAKGAPAIVTSNQCGGVHLKIVNGTKCLLEKLL